MSINKNLSFLKSAFSTKEVKTDTTFAIDWIKTQNKKIGVDVKKIDFKDLQLWGFDAGKTKLSHETGKFLSNKVQIINMLTYVFEYKLG